MSDTCEIVTVVRKDHPAGKVDINKSDFKKDDVIFSEDVKKVVKKEFKKVK